MARKKKSKSDDFIKIEEKDKKVVIEEVKKEEKKNVEIPRNKIYKHPLTNFVLVLVLLSSLAFFIIGLFFEKDYSITNMISSLLLVVFSLLYVTFSMTINRKNKTIILLSGLFLLGYFTYGSLLTLEVFKIPNNRVLDFSGMELTEVISWSEENKIDIVQDYEYSDMISEYHIISQSVRAGTKLNGLKSLTVAVSEGPNPSKEVAVPNMVNWESERVLEFIKNNYLSNVDVDFEESSKQKDTVIEQNKSGNMRRNEKLELVFSYGEELGFDEVKLRDLSGMTEFEAKFYLKQNQLKYKFEEVFSSKVKKGLVVKQDVKPGTMVAVNDDRITVSISKGPEIKIPDLKGMSMTDITEWVIKNKLKLEFTDKYDDSIEENSVISANYKEGEIVAEGTEIEVVISRGKLIMPEFKSYNDFKEWADKYDIRYEEKHEFSSSVKAGEAIKYSYKTGDTIRNNDPVVVTVSDGKESSVPSVVGLTKDAAASKLKSAGFGYGFVYSYSSTVSKGKVIRQSISAGSKVAEGTTITVTISNGKKPSSSSSSSSSSGSSSSKPTCTKKTYTIGRNLNTVFDGESGYSKVSSALYSFFANNYPNVKISVVGVADTGMSSGSYVGGIGPGTTIISCNSSPYVIQIAK